MATYKEAEYGSYDWLKREIAGYLGLGYNVDTLEPTDHGKIDSIVQSGLSQFYFPAPLPAGKDEPPVVHRWSFLSPVAELQLVVDQSVYELPDDFAGVIDDGFTVGD